jgi:hypothetical protein
MKNSYLLLTTFWLITATAFAQIGMGGAPHSSAVLDLKSPGNDKAFYPPRLTTVQRKALPDPQPGAFVYDTDQATFFFFDGRKWTPLAVPANGIVSPVSFVAEGGATPGRMGTSVVITDDYALVGASSWSAPGILFSGAVFAFSRTASGWQLDQTIVPTDAASGDNFGSAIALDGNVALIGSIAANSERGAVYAYERLGSTWSFRQRFTAADAVPGMRFGSSIALQGTTALIGVPEATSTYLNQGAAYLFELSGSIWTQRQRLTANDAQQADRFGENVAISNTLGLLISASNKMINGNAGRGAVYSFQNAAVVGGSSYVQRQRLIANNGSTNHYFGNGGIAISPTGDAFVASDRGSNPEGGQSGSVHVFRATINVFTGIVSWAETQLLWPGPYLTGADEFGSSVSVSGNTLLVGAPQTTVTGNAAQGAAYVFTRPSATGSWSLSRQLTDQSPQHSSFGCAVSLSNGRYAVGALRYLNFQGKVAFGYIDL